MGRPPEIVIRDAYLQSRDGIRDIGISDGRIERISDDLADASDVEIEADGNLVAPGFVDAHVHLDQALSQDGDRKPAYGDEPFRKQRALALAEDYFESTSREAIADTVADVARTAVAKGVLHVRTHAYVDSEVGTESVEAVESARQELNGLLDMEVVAFPQQGILEADTKRVLEASVDSGADLVGGLDPASVNGDIGRTIDAWFDVATGRGVDIDVHLHDEGTLGLYTFDRLVDRMQRANYEGRVTASHGYALADLNQHADGGWVPGGSVEGFLARIADVDLKVITCYLTTRAAMPVKRLQDHGIAVGHGSDQVRDMWSAHGNIDPIEEALIQSLQLDARNATTNEHLDRIWRLMTHGGAGVLGIDDEYGIATGTPADIVVHDSPSRQWAIIEQSPPRVVLKDGQVVARNGELVG